MQLVICQFLMAFFFFWSIREVMDKQHRPTEDILFLQNKLFNIQVSFVPKSSRSSCKCSHASSLSSPTLASLMKAVLLASPPALFAQRQAPQPHHWPTSPSITATRPLNPGMGIPCTTLSMRKLFLTPTVSFPAAAPACPLPPSLADPTDQPCSLLSGNYREQWGLLLVTFFPDSTTPRCFTGKIWLEKPRA